MGVLESMKIDAKGGKILLSGKRSHFICSSDFSFPEKWDGLWFLDTKLLDYLSFRVGGVWLSGQSLKRAEYYGHKAVFVFENATLTLFVPEERSGLVAVVEAAEPDDIEIEFGVDIRSKSENLHFREYVISGSGRMTSFSSDIGEVFFRPSEFLEESFEGYKIHTGGSQRCFVYRGKTHTKRLVCQFLTYPEPVNWAAELKAKEMYYESIVSRFSSPDRELEMAVRWAMLSLEMMLKRTEKGMEMYAGYPWFLETWGRDAGWCIPAFVDMGEHEKARMLIETLLSRTEEGIVPNRLKPIDYNSADAGLLLVIAAGHYIRASGDVKFLEKITGKLKMIIEHYRQMDVDGDGFPEVHSGQWMDTIERKGELIEIDALWIKALEEYYYLMQISGGYHNHRHVDELKKRFSDKFFREFVLDRTEPESREIRPNMLVPAYLGVAGRADAERAVEKSRNLLLKNGLVCSLSWIESKYDPESYHNGQAWGLCTMWLASASRLLGKDVGNFVLSDWKRHGIGHFGETWNPETAEPRGCFAQAWTAALVIRHVYEFVAGIRCTGAGVSAAPSGAPDMEMSVRCKGKWMRIRISGGVFSSEPVAGYHDFQNYLWNSAGYEPDDSWILSYFRG